MLGVIIGLLILASLLWIGGEMHYRSCLRAAEASFPYAIPEPNPYKDGGSVAADPEPRRRAIRECSRVPV